MSRAIIRKTRNEKRIYKIVLQLFPKVSPSFSEMDVYFLATKGVEDVGFLHLILDGKRILLQGVGVKEKYRSVGIGGMLVDTAINFSEKTGVDLFLKVKPDNVPALNLYAKKGFSIKKLRDVYILQRKLCS